jgi:hypothetical protein
MSSYSAILANLLLASGVRILACSTQESRDKTNRWWRGEVLGALRRRSAPFMRCSIATAWSSAACTHIGPLGATFDGWTSQMRDDEPISRRCGIVCINSRPMSVSSGPVLCPSAGSIFTDDLPLCSRKPRYGQRGWRLVAQPIE